MRRSERKKTMGDLSQTRDASKSTVDEQELREQIALKAYEMYEKRGWTHGCDVEDWLEAEKLVSTELKKERDPKTKMPRKRSKHSTPDKATGER